MVDIVNSVVELVVIQFDRLDLLQAGRKIRSRVTFLRSEN